MHDPQHICVGGGGSWGTALAHHLATRGHAVTLWLRDQAVARSINATHENPRYLPGVTLHPSLRATNDPAAFNCPHVLIAIPSQQLRSSLLEYKEFFQPDVVIINAAKGLETGTLAPCSAIVAETLAGLGPRYSVLSGPSFAAEVVRGLPTAVVLAARDENLGRRLRDMISSPNFRCYSSTDVIGVEMGGALKNVMAIAAGLSDGLDLGHNSRAALITRGLTEMSRIGASCGAMPRTFMGLSGLGDLTLSCTGDLSRNRQVGLRLGQGEKLAHITQSLGMVAEGVKTTAAVHDLARHLAVEAPITDAVYRILYEDCPPRQAVQRLMTRSLREE